jgi:hypothetical protein
LLVFLQTVQDARFNHQGNFNIVLIFTPRHSDKSRAFFYQNTPFPLKFGKDHTTLPITAVNFIAVKTATRKLSLQQQQNIMNHHTFISLNCICDITFDVLTAVNIHITFLRVVR